MHNLHTENFSGYQAWGTGGGTAESDRRTAVGSFTPFGETGSGLAKVGDGGKLQVRADNVMPWGRYSTSRTGSAATGSTATTTSA